MKPFHCSLLEIFDVIFQLIYKTEIDAQEVFRVYKFGFSVQYFVTMNYSPSLEAGSGFILSSIEAHSGRAF